MTVYVALLRGINVGGRALLPMAELREAATGCGFSSVRTYIQSGNVVLASPAGPDEVAEQLAAAIAATGRLRTAPAIAVLSRDELRAVVADNPYVDRSTDPKQLHVAFTVRGTRPVAPIAADLERFAPDELTVRGGQTYLFLPRGIGRSKLAEFLSRPKGTVGTVRNWRTVTTLLDLAEAVDGD